MKAFALPSEEDNEQPLPVPALDMSKVKGQQSYGNLPLAMNSDNRLPMSAIRLDTDGSNMIHDTEVYQAFAHQPDQQSEESEHCGLTPAASKHYDCVNPLYR